MPPEPIYLDYNATAPLRPEAHARMQELIGQPLNPSSVHRFGRDAKKHLESARGTVAACVSAWPNEVIFTGSGTEANSMALRGFPERRLLVSAVEHSSVLKARGEAQIIPVDENGIVDLAALEKMLKDDDRPALVSVMLANNETGVIQPVADTAALCRAHGALLHCDAVQGLGKIPVDFGALAADMMTIAGHKCGGPVGAAALIVRRSLAVASLLTGGGQELGRRAGTENVVAIVGFAAAAEASQASELAPLRGWLDELEALTESVGGTVFGRQVSRLPNTSCIAMPGVSNEVQLMDFDLKGFAVSAGSACSSGRIESSHVLAAMGIAQTMAQTAIRVSGGWRTVPEHIKLFGENWKNTCGRLAKSAS